MQADARLWALLAAILISFLICGRALLADAVALWRTTPRPARRRAVQLGLVVALAGWALASTQPLRAGRHNEHSLWFLASSLSDVADLFAEREAAPRALFALYATVNGAAWAGALLFQRLCWLLSGLLVFAALRRGRAGLAGAGAGALLYLLSAHAVLLASSFAPDSAALLLLLVGVYAAVRFATADGPAAARDAFVVACAAGLILADTKFEFGLAVGWGLAVALAAGRAQDLRARPGVPAAAATAAALLSGLFLAVNSHPSNKLLPADPLGPGALLAALASNLDYQLVDSTLGPLMGANAARLLLAGAALWGLYTGRRSRFWLPFLGGWALLFVALYPPMAVYPLSHARHHLFVLLPFAFAGGLLTDRAAAWEGRRRVVVRAALAGGLALYGFAGLEALDAARGALRTHDRELAFLHEARAAWPEGCAVAVGPDDLRGRMLRRYFPAWDGGGPRPACLLAYRAPSETVFGGRAEPVLAARGEPWREARFAHAWSTDAHGPWEWTRFELAAPVPVVVGFYRVPEGAAPRWDFADAGPEPEAPAAWNRAIIHPFDAAYEGSVEACFKRRLSATPWAPAGARTCFDRAVEDARARGDAADEVLLLASRASFLRGLGLNAQAREDVAAARRVAAAARYAGRGLARADFAARFDTMPVLRSPSS